MADGIVSHVLESCEEEEWECPGLEPFFFDVAAAVADHERRVRREQEEARQKVRQEALDKQRKQAYDRICDYYPKQGGHYMNRCYFYLNHFDIDEESSFGPMRYTDKVYKMDDYCPLFNAVNILSVKIASLDVKFPIHVYGTVIARDSLDRKCVYVFRCSRDNCQVINSKTQSLTLEGPKRGLVLLDDLFMEIDLKIKDVRQKGAQRGRDRDLSKGFLRIKGSTNRILKKSLVESRSLATRLSTVEVGYSVVKDGLEALVAVEVLRGEFRGKITACTAHVPDSFLLHDSKLGGKKVGGVEGVIQLLQPVVTVSRGDKLIIVVQTSDGVSKRAIEFAPRIRSSDKEVITVGATKMRVKVSWSTMNW